MQAVEKGRLRCRTARLAALAVGMALLVAADRATADGQKAEGAAQLKSSRVYVFVGKVGLGHEHAVVGKLKSGEVQLGAKSKAGEIVFDMPSFTADTDEACKYIGLEGTTAAARQKEVTANMLGADVLNVRKFPTATFLVSSALPLNKRSADGHPLYRLDGDFTLHGVKRPVKVEAEAIDNPEGVRLRGSFAINQTDYGIRPYSKAFGAVGVTDELTIYGDLLLAMPRTAQRTAGKRK